VNVNRSCTSRVEGRVSVRPRLAKPSKSSKPSKLVWLVLACGLGATHVRAQECAPPPRDCVASASAAEASVASLPTDVRAGAAFVASYRVAACRARLACLVSDGDLQRVEAWAESELRAAREQTDASARATWRAGLADRVPGLRTPVAVLSPNAAMPGATPNAAAIPGRMPANPAILEQVVRLRDDLELNRRLEPLLVETERTARLPRDGSTPAVCRGDLRERLQALVREGAAANASHASSLRGKLDDLCEPFARWERPTEVVENRVRSFVAQVNRVEGFLNDIVRCYEPGPYDGRCRNAYSPPTEDGLAQARAALREVAAVKRVIRGVPERPFPCRDAIWERLVATRWTLRTAEAQIPSLGSAAVSVCETIGVLPRDVERAHRELSDTVERIRAQAAQTARTTQAALDNLRTMYGLD
jgi:hypothetical protein